MSTKQTYVVNRAMHGDGRDYARGDTRQLSDTDAAPLVATGALLLKGEDAVVREPAVRHTFGTEPSAVNAGGYTSAVGDGILARSSDKSVKPAPAKPANKSA